MSDVQELAGLLGADERTLRRAVGDGLIQARREGPRRIAVPASERRYLNGHWELLSRLRRALRTEPNVRLAVLFGSFARGDDRPDSDLDLLVALADHGIGKMGYLTLRLSTATGREVELIELEQARRAPFLLLEILTYGRVLVDREDVWARLRAEQPLIRRRAAREHKRAKRAAAEAIEALQAG